MDKYLTMMIDDYKRYNNAYQDILDNAELDTFSVEAIETGIIKKLLDS